MANANATCDNGDGAFFFAESMQARTASWDNTDHKSRIDHPAIEMHFDGFANGVYHLNTRKQ